MPACSSAGHRGTRWSRWAGAYWIETQVASIWRAARGDHRPLREGVPADESRARRGLEACSFYWAYFVATASWRTCPVRGLGALSDDELGRLVDWSFARCTWRSPGCCTGWAASAAAGRAGGEVRTAAFIGGLVTIVVALDPPIDPYAEQLFWVHMIQHVLLLTVAPPLILFGRPWPRMWRGLPLGSRTRMAGRSPAPAGPTPLRALACPIPAWLLFNATIVAWHIPAAYDATLTHPAGFTTSNTRCSSSSVCCSGRA